MFKSSLFRLLITSSIYIIITNAVIIRRDKSILFPRVAFIVLLFTNILYINNSNPVVLDIEIYGYVGFINNHILSYIPSFYLYNGIILIFLSLCFVRTYLHLLNHLVKPSNRKTFLDILNKRLTVGFIASAAFTLLISFFIKLAFDYYFCVVPVIGKITYIDLSFFSIVVWFKLLFTVLLEYIMGDMYTTPAGDILIDWKNYTLHMDNNSAKASSSTSSSTSSSASSSASSSTPASQLPSQATLQSTASSNLDGDSKMLTIDEQLKLMDQFNENLEYQNEMVKKMRELKISKKLKYYLDSRGGLDLDAPASTSDGELERFAKEVGIIDRIYNKKVSEYEKLEGKDLMSNNSSISKNYLNTKDFVKKQYEDLFDK